MGTRGIYGFYKNGVDKLTYNHYDSYPEELGLAIVRFVKETSIEVLNQIFDKIKMVEQTTKPTPEQIEECKEYSNSSVSNQSLNDWYCLLRETQGSPELYLGDLKYMIDNKAFIRDSLFCEWGYIINLTDNKLEIYRGFQTKPNKSSNRYKIENEKKSKDFYYACEIITTFPLSEIPDDWLKIIKREEQLRK